VIAFAILLAVSLIIFSVVSDMFIFFKRGKFNIYNEKKNLQISLLQQNKITKLTIEGKEKFVGAVVLRQR